MGVLFSRNGSSEPWFTLQDEPVLAIAGEGEGDQRVPPRRGRGLVKLVEPTGAANSRSLAARSSATAPVYAGTQFTRAAPLERLSAHANRTLMGIATPRYGALALSGVIVLLVVLPAVIWAAGGSSDRSAIERDRVQIARLSAQRAGALRAAARAETASQTAAVELAHWRSLALAGRTPSAPRRGGNAGASRMRAGR